jgi:hypothetical protein
VAELEQLRGPVAEQARDALAGAVSGAAGEPGERDGEPDEELLAHALGRLEAALRARTAKGV